MQKLLGTSDTFLNPNFGSAFIFELRKDKHHNYFVRVLNKNTLYPGAIRFDVVTVKGLFFKLFLIKSMILYYMKNNFSFK